MAGYIVIENPLTEDPEDYKGVILTGKAAGLDDVLGLVNYRNTGLTESVARAVVQEVTHSIARLLREGRRVQLPFVTLYPVMRGPLKGPLDTFKVGRNYIVINAETDRGFEEEVTRDMPLEKKQPTARVPQPQEYLDGRTEQVSTTLTPGGGGMVKGTLLQIDKSDLEQGVFALYPDGSRIRARDYMRNTDGELSFTWPDNMPAGQVALQVITIVRGTSELRSGELRRRLTVSNGTQP